MTVAWTDSTVEIAGTKLHLRRGGKGPVALVLHRDSGTPDRTTFHDMLAATHDVIVPDHPGWGKSQRAEWMRATSR